MNVKPNFGTPIEKGQEIAQRGKGKKEEKREEVKICPLQGPLFDKTFMKKENIF